MKNMNNGEDLFCLTFNKFSKSFLPYLQKIDNLIENIMCKLETDQYILFQFLFSEDKLELDLIEIIEVEEKTHSL